MRSARSRPRPRARLLSQRGSVVLANLAIWGLVVALALYFQKA